MAITINGQNNTLSGLSVGGIDNGIIQPADLSTGGPSWDAGGNVLISGIVTASQINVGAGSTVITIQTGIGSVGIGSATPQAKLDVNGNIKGTLVTGSPNAGGTNPFPAASGPTSVDYTGIPKWARRIVVVFNEVSTNAANNDIVVQLGISGSYSSSNYVSSSGQFNFTSSTGGGTSTSGFNIWNRAAANVVSGTMIISFSYLGGGIESWVSSFSGKTSTALVVVAGGSWGNINSTTSTAVDSVRITTANGTALFDGGTVNLYYEG